MKIKIYEIAFFTGDLIKPLQRVSKTSLSELERYIESERNSPAQECSIITRTIDQKGVLLSTEVYFGTIRRFLDQEHSKNALI